MQGLAFGANSGNDIFSRKVDFSSLYKTLKREDWQSVNMGLINTCFRLSNPAEMAEVLKQWSAVYNLPVMLPSVEARPLLEHYADQISVLSFSCMVTPGAIRSYVHRFGREPASLKLLGWWLAREIAPDEKWLQLKLGPYYNDCREDIAEGMNAFREGLPFLHLLNHFPLSPYEGTEIMNDTTKKFSSRIVWSPHKHIFPAGGLSREKIDECGLALRR